MNVVLKAIYYDCLGARLDEILILELHKVPKSIKQRHMRLSFGTA